ncbi:gephyrin-like molybdotransferase Glp [Patulibacter sp. SYSU D01012]|uniref:molybdopterin molybdotransferase MoeA n=1 Tax=Patulibacter sp. SYSU D01012 TaxID=2817381 RepID=UPI001B308D9D|nr:gephyrin-like molybdotransferase Glp [Patulibacter sp. SYSU D01012]
MADPLSLADARAAAVALGAAARTPVREVALADAADHVPAHDVRAAGDHPRFDASAMDGYAVRAADTTGAAPADPAVLRLVDEARAGHPADVAVAPGTALRISTGAALPAGADAVVRAEDATERDDAVHVGVAVAPGHDVRATGEDVARGDVVVRAGETLHPGRLALLAGAGVDALHCRRSPTATVVVTGDEVAPGAAELAAGAVRDVNGVAIPALLRAAGIEVLDVVRVGDDRAATMAAFAAARGDLVVSCGGVSVGRHDHVRAALERLGGQEHVGAVALQPGKPTWIGALPRRAAAEDGAVLRPVVALVGNPGAALVTAALFAVPLARAMAGAAPAPVATARLAEETRGDGRRARALRAVLADDGDGGRRVHVLPGQQAHRLASLAAADVLAVLPPSADVLPAGTPVEIVRLPAG